MNRERIEAELSILKEGGLYAELILNPTPVVCYHGVPSGGTKCNLANTEDVIVPVPPGYPATPIDLAALPASSPLLPKLKGGANSQGTIDYNGKPWQLASYHPHGNGGGPSWDQMKHGFHTYLDHLIAWLHNIN